MTLCGFHHAEGHAGQWQDCAQCRASFPTEMCVWYGTNEYNFEKLPNPPAYEPTRCDGCGVVIKLSEGAYSQGLKGTLSWLPEQSNAGCSNYLPVCDWSRLKRRVTPKATKDKPLRVLPA